MFLPSWFRILRPLSPRTTLGRKPGQQCTAHRRGLRLSLEQLEDRTLLSNYTAATVSDLIADINASNQAGGLNTITLTAPTTSPYILTAVNNTTDGATGLPVIAANDNLSIIGNGDTIERSAATGTPAFRLFDVALSAALTLQNLTLQGGLASGSRVSADGGGIYNQGTLTLNGVTVQNNAAKGSDGTQYSQAGQSAAGGGIYSNGTLTLEGNTKVQSNQALGGRGGPWPYGGVGVGGSGWGGGVYVAAGSATMTGSVLSSNTAQGGRGGWTPSGRAGTGGNGFGGGLHVLAGTVTLTGTVLSSNTAQGGQGGGGFTLKWGVRPSGGNGGNGFGGALNACGGTISLYNDTVTGNSALGGAGGPGQGAGGNGGNGFGGALNAGGGTITLHKDSMTGNSALSGGGGSGYRSGSPGLGEGGGLYINPLASVCLDAFTLANVINNTASTQDPNIHGSYTICP